jgi:hypothetical protein
LCHLSDLPSKGLKLLWNLRFSLGAVDQYNRTPQHILVVTSLRSTVHEWFATFTAEFTLGIHCSNRLDKSRYHSNSLVKAKSDATAYPEILSLSFKLQDNILALDPCLHFLQKMVVSIDFSQ